MITTIVLSDLVPEELLMQASPDVVRAVVRNVMDGARAFWIKRAGEKLHSTRRDYINGIQPVEEGDGWAGVALLGVLPLMVEEGASAFDMHNTLLGPNVPVAGPGQRGKHVIKHGPAKGGFYRVVPFRHQVPGTIGQGGGQVMGEAYEGHPGVPNAKALGLAVWTAAKQLAATRGMPGGKTQWGGRLPSGMAPLLRGAPKFIPGLNRYAAPHAADIYAGMVRNSKTYAKATQNTYSTFRVISDSQPDKWLHPGIQAANLSDDVMTYVADNAEKAFVAMFTAGGLP